MRWTRLAGALALLAAIVTYDAFARRLPNLPVWWDVAFLSLGLIVATFLLVWLALPARRASSPRRLGYAVVLLVAATLALEAIELDVPANVTKLAAMTAAGWWFLTFFDAASWVLLVALLIVPVDIFSVARGPTRHIVEKQPDVFQLLSVAFPIPGEQASAQLGLPDVLFFALFLAAAERFALRPAWTWLAMVLSFGATLATAVWLGVGGLPALPLLSAAFVLVNADLLWRSWRPRRPTPS